MLAKVFMTGERCGLGNAHARACTFELTSASIDRSSSISYVKLSGFSRSTSRALIGVLLTSRDPQIRSVSRSCCGLRLVPEVVLAQGASKVAECRHACRVTRP